MQVEYHLCEATTQGYPVIKPRLSLPSKPSPFAAEPMIPAVRLPLKQSQIPTRPLPAMPSMKRHRRRALSKAVEQLIYALMAIALDAVVYHYLASWAVYRIVGLVVIGILWSSFAGRAALRKPVDMMETISLPVFPTGNYTDETYTYLKAIKKNLVGDR